MTPQESRARLATLRDAARSAGLSAVMRDVDSILAIATARSIAILEAALAAPSAPAAVAAMLDNPPQVQAPGITPPRMPSMMVRKPAPPAVGIVIDVGRHPAPPARQSVLAGIKKPETNRPAEPPERAPTRMAKVPPRPTGPDKFDDENPLVIEVPSCRREIDGIEERRSRTSVPGAGAWQSQQRANP